jgi:hypothetical protein
MKELEFKSKLKNHRINIPTRIQAELKANSDKAVRVIVLIDENELSDDTDFQNMATTQFLNGYSGSDSIYDK